MNSDRGPAAEHAAADSAETPFHRLDDYLELPRLSGLVMSPDGTRLVLASATLNEKKTAYSTALWEVDPAGHQQARRLTYGAKGESGAAFNAAGDLLFLAARGEEGAPASLWLLPRAGGEAQELLTRKAGVAGVRAARDTDLIVVTSSAFPAAHSAEDDERIRAARKDKKVDAILHTAFPIRYWDHDLGPEVPQLLAGGSDGEFDALLKDPGLREASVDVAADGSFAVASWQVAGALAVQRTVLERIDLVAGERSRLVDEDDADLGGPAISPDGTSVAYLREAHSTPEQAPVITAHLLDLRTGTSRQVAQGWDRWPTSLRWLPDGTGLVVTADQYSRGPVFLVDIDAGAVRQITEDDATYTEVSVDPGGEALYALRSACAEPPHPVRVDIATGVVTNLLGPTEQPALPGVLTEVVTAAEDGVPLRAWLALPHDADGDNPAPLLVWIHGGPLGSWNSWQWRWNPWLMVARGYAVLLPDPALSTGFGQQFIQRGWGRWGKEPYTDLMALTDAAESLPEIDAERTAAMGGSFGGYMANWIAGHTDRFKAIVTHASLWALDQFGPTTDAPWYWVREMTPEMAVENSPHLYVADIETPMLVIHGDKDYRVPIGEALRLWYELNAESALPADDKGRSEHQFLFFPSEHHWVLAPQHTKVWYEVVHAFLADKVLGSPVDVPEELGVQVAHVEQ